MTIFPIRVFQTENRNIQHLVHQREYQISTHEHRKDPFPTFDTHLDGKTQDLPLRGKDGEVILHGTIPEIHHKVRV